MSATSRFLLDPAPDGLFLVQDLVNTSPVPAYAVRDLLHTVADARRWVGTVRSSPAVGATPGRITSPDLASLRALREEVVAVLAGRPIPPRVVSTEVAVGPDGRARLSPVGRGVDWLTSAVWGEVLLAQHDGRWARLKVCRNPVCPCAFYDGSRNNSRVWHDVRTCGNAANLRASRARRRAAAGT